MCNGGMASKDTQIKSVAFVPRGCLKYTVYYNGKTEKKAVVCTVHNRRRCWYKKRNSTHSWRHSMD
jgi:hypothetical protein